MTTFQDARAFLLQHRTDYDAAVKGFRWPDPVPFNWALDWFDAELARNADSKDRPALWIVDAGSNRETKLSFEALSRRSNQVANFLRAQGLKRGDHLLLLLGNVVPLWETMLAAMKLGVVVIPATTLLTPDELRDRLDRGRARIVVATQDQVAKFSGLGDDKLVRIVVNASSKQEGWIAYEQAAEFPKPSRRTGRPTPTIRCCCISRQALRQNRSWCGTASAATRSARSRPCSGSGCSPATCISTFPRRAGPSMPGAACSRRGMPAPPCSWSTSRASTPRACSRPSAVAASPRCARRRRCGGCSSRRSSTTFKVSLREVCGAGEPLNPEVIDQVRAAWGLTIRDGYGQTETTALAGNSPGQKVKIGSMGRPLPGYRVQITDIDGQVTKEGEVTLLLGDERPAGLMQGYQGDDGKLSGADGALYRSGDVVFADDEGYLTFVGRSDDVFKSSDYRISPFELESILLEHESVAEAAVVPSPDPIRLAIPKAYVLLVAGKDRSAETALSIFQHLHARLAPFKRIRRIELVTELPKTISGKIRRVQLRRLEHDDNRGDPLRGDEFREEDFPELQKVRSAGSEN